MISYEHGSWIFYSSCLWQAIPNIPKASTAEFLKYLGCRRDSQEWLVNAVRLIKVCKTVSYGGSPCTYISLGFVVIYILFASRHQRPELEKGHGSTVIEYMLA